MNTKDKAILIIDDCEATRLFLEKLLKPLGYSLISAEDGAIGISKFKNFQSVIELVITDIVMPEKEGIETIKEIFEMKPGQKLIAMSAGNEEYLRWAAAMGAVETIRKPFPEDLKEKITALLKSSTS